MTSANDELWKKSEERLRAELSKISGEIANLTDNSEIPNHTSREINEILLDERGLLVLALCAWTKGMIDFEGTQEEYSIFAMASGAEPSTVYDVKKFLAVFDTIFEFIERNGRFVPVFHLPEQ